MTRPDLEPAAGGQGVVTEVPDVIRARDVVKSYGDLRAVDGVSFSVARGEYFGLLGPNGAGKTTLIRMIYGFSPMQSGQLDVFGLDVRTHWREIRRRIGVCQQDNTLDTDLRVEENLLVFAGYFGLDRGVAKRKADELLEFFALDHKRQAQVSELSGGMIRRLILARALVSSPELLILDEPTVGLDPQSRHQVWQKLEELRSQGLTVLLTTHYMDEAEHLCERLVIMDRGHILVQGSPRGLVAEHAGARVVELRAPRADLDGLARELAVDGLEVDDLGERMLVYLPPDSPHEASLVERFCQEGRGSCQTRSAGLEDVFLRLTGRGLRE